MLTLWSRYGLLLLLSSISLAFLCFPQLALQGALRGMQLWWTVLMPALLPFWVVTEILFQTGWVQKLGASLQRFSYPLLRLPGAAIFALLMGWIAGNPTGAYLAAQLRRDGKVNRAEGERILAAACTASPLFLTGAVATGFFHTPALAGLVLLSHHLSNGLLLLFLRCTLWRHGEAQTPYAHLSAPTSPTPPLGKLLRDATEKSMQTMLILLGLLATCAALMQVLEAIDWIIELQRLLIGWATQTGLPFLGLLVPALLGSLEMTVGTYLVANEVAALPLRLSIVAGIIAFGGFCIHAQVASMIAPTDLRYRSYFWARLTHALLAISVTFLLIRLFPTLLHDEVTTFALPVPSPTLQPVQIFALGALGLWLWRRSRRSSSSGIMRW